MEDFSWIRAITEIGSTGLLALVLILAYKAFPQLLKYLEGMQDAIRDNTGEIKNLSAAIYKHIESNGNGRH